MTRSQAGSPTAERAEVDDRGEPAVAQQQVAGGDVAVHPDRRPAPLAPRAPRPRRRCAGGVDRARERREAGPRLGVVDRERPPRWKLCAPAGGPSAGAALQGAQEAPRGPRAKRALVGDPSPAGGSPSIQRCTDQGQG